MLCASLNAGSNQEMYDFKIQMEDTDENSVGSSIGASLSCQTNDSEPATLTISVTANAFSGNASYTLPINSIRLYFSTSSATTTYTDYLRIPLGSNYSMDNAGYTLDLNNFSITLNNI